MDENELNRTFKSKNKVIVPGENLINEGEYLDLKNLSSITSEFRIALKVTIGDTVYELNPDTEHILFKLCDKTETETFAWVYDNGYYYYTTDGTNRIMPPLNDGYEIKILESLILDGNYFDNAFSMKDVVISIELQGKQNKVDWDNINWEQLGEVTVNG